MLKRRIELVKRAYESRIITKDNAIQNLWDIHSKCRNRVLEGYAIKIIKAIDLGIL